MNSFFYDGQIRRFLMQFMRLLSHFQVEFKNRDGGTTLRQVPVVYGDSSRQVAQILQGNTENAAPSVPAIAVIIEGLEYTQDRLQDPHHVSKLHLRGLAYDESTAEYGHSQGDSFTIERMMPAPYKLTLRVDIWTSNTEQKLQILEQIMPLFNPALEIQSTDNYLDWTSLSSVFLTSTNWSSRSVPVGAGEDIDIATLKFELPIWLSLPIKVKRLGVIHKIIASIWGANGEISRDLQELDMSDPLGSIVYTPMNYGIIYLGTVLQLYKQGNIIYNDNNVEPYFEAGEPASWKSLLDQYGVVRNGISTIRIEQAEGPLIVGTISEHPMDDTLLLFVPYEDTFPVNTLNPINAIVDPYGLNVTTAILGASSGTRYMILNDIGADGYDTDAWGSLVAKTNDIIEFDGANWSVAFSSDDVDTVEYVTNIKTGLQYKWEGGAWTKSVEGKYGPGQWGIAL